MMVLHKQKPIRRIKNNLYINLAELRLEISLYAIRELMNSNSYMLLFQVIVPLYRLFNIAIK